MNKRKGGAMCANLRWSAQDEATFAEMMADQKTYAQIGRALGRTEKAVEQHAYVYRQRLRKKGQDISDFSRRGKDAITKQTVIQPQPVYESNKDRVVELLAYTAIFTGGCFLTLVVMTVLLIAIS
jgi:biotin operon repressor